MLKSGRFKKVLIITMIVILVLSTVALAAENIYVKKLTATHGRIKFKVDGKDVTKEIESKYGSPAFVVHEYGDRSYVPIRAIAELMGLEIEYDNATHTAEIIDVKSEKYEAEIEKKDKKIAELSKEAEELKKEIEKLKKNVVEKTDLEVIEKKINDSYGTYEDVYFDITLKESNNKIDVQITMDLRDARQESAWNRMSFNNRKILIEDITNIIATEFTNVDIYGSIYDDFYRRNVLTFNKRSNSNVSISYSDRATGTSSRYIDDLVYDEFYEEGIKDAYITKIDTDSRTIYFDIVFSDKYATEWSKVSNRDIEDILDKIADEVIYDYYYDYNDNYDKDISVYVYMSNTKQGVYSRYYNERYGEFKRY